MEEAPCILCGKPGAPWFHKADKFPPHERFQVVRCPDCGLGWVSPRPTVAEIGRYYPPTYSGAASEDDGGGVGDPGPSAPAALLRRAERRYRFHLLRFETRQLVRATGLTRGDAVLDVGCAGGERLLVMQQAGLAPAGVDISPAADAARRRTGLDVRRGTLAEAHYEAGRFRAVTLYNVLEHVHDPRGLLAEIRRVLAPGGLIAVQSPNAASVQARIFGRRWAALDAPRDLYYYTWRHIVRLLEEEGFRVTGTAWRTSFLHPPTAVVSIAPWLDPQRFWLDEATGSAAAGFARRAGWAALTVLVAPAVWLESALGACAIPTVFARVR